MTKNGKSIILGGVAVLSWATVATAFKIALMHLSVFCMLLIATVTSFVFYTVMMVVEKKWTKLRALPKDIVVKTALLGILNPVVYYLVLFQAYDLLPAQMAQPLNYAWPIFLLVFLAVFNHDKIPVKKYIGMLISVCGVVCISLGGGGVEGHVSVSGVLLALFSAVLWAAYWMLNNRLSRQVDATMALFLEFFAGSVVLGVIGCFIGVEIDSLEGLLSGIYIGLFEMGIPFLTFGMALRITTNPALINQMCYLSPFLSLFLIAMVLGETIALGTCVGLVLIVIGLIYNQYFVKDHREVEVANESNMGD
ncbi:MAG: DMT family transporter [Muribaculaceae bacterium]|nr:DMT family transporter [Muribaculaceae bacterium]